MDALQYEKISAPFRKNVNLIILTNKALTSIGCISYPLLLLYSFFSNTKQCIPLLIIPASGFILLTFIRKKINRKRPYEALEINPIIQKDTKGNSMPSRHVFSMSIIAFSWFLLSPTVAIFLLLCAIAIAFIRVIGGVHYPSDVCIAIISALIWSLLYLL